MCGYFYFRVNSHLNDLNLMTGNGIFLQTIRYYFCVKATCVLFTYFYSALNFLSNNRYF